MLGLVLQVGLRPDAGQHDDRRHPAQFAGDRGGQQRLVVRLATGRRPRPCPQTMASWVTALPVMCTWSTRSVAHQVAADIGRAGDDLQHAEVDQRREDVLVDGQHRVHDRVEFQRDDPVVRVQLVQHVERGDGRDVAGTQHRANPLGAGRISLRHARVSTHRLRGDTRLHPDLGGEAVQQQPVVDVVRQHLHRDTAAGCRSHPVAVDRAGAVLQCRKTARQRAEPGQHRPGTGDPFLADQR